ncbi:MULTISPECIES: OmpP1/FadL family transporter [unclassified Paracoccus (in: a-proteobacteria)]|uniref:OmpP1/FadL family transporter n=1 Tax=unclassified Paracoccus (in: a-proteobacteria) TaxID=2688777 RepID=UPI0012B3D7C6|nr:MULTISPECIES: outer membrane protein transport protein [unclassified Paracoccus (in: a-proteobacteria)]UXU75255.1 outer membrane protein transport protein [Paracoccus sp. SMMA_5]UXU81156.1 outer membrane protein transport protein [Paracoccus sp. SMMA_5_TC]
MNKIITGIGALLASAAPVLAGGIERAPQSLAPLFEQGNYAELSFGGVDPSVRGTDVAGFATGDVAQGYGFFGLSYKHQFNENLSGVLIVEQPFGADIRYPTAPGGSPVLGGTRVEVNSTTYTALLRYKFDNNFSVHGGIRGSHADGLVSLRGAGYAATSGYDLDIDGAWGVGWVAGVAYEVPEIAARVSLTYNSPIEHDFDMTESGGPLPATFSGNYTVKTPRSWTLEGQTGIAADTLLFGSIRWVKWSEFQVDNFLFPIASPAGSIPLVEVEDTTTYTIGVGRKFTENWSGSMSFLYEPSEGETVSPLAPVNGRKGVTLAAVYTRDNMKITTGINYTKLGDATLGVGPSGAKREVARMNDSEAWGVGVRIGYSF